MVHVDAQDDLWPPPTPAQIEKSRQFLDAGRFDKLEEAGQLFAPGKRRLYGIHNYLAMGHRLGIVKEVYWVIPITETPDAEALEDLRSFLVGRKNPRSDPSGTDLRISGSRIEGTISGVPVTIGKLSDLPRPTSPVWLDIELDFFSELYKNPVASSYLGMLGGFTQALKKADLKPALTTISCAPQGGEFPLADRYLGPLLAQLLADPHLLEQAPPEDWSRREEAAYQEFFQQFEEAARIYAGLLESHPDDPSLHYALAMAQLRTGDEVNARQHLARAADLDPTYVFGYLSAAAWAEKKKKPEAAEKFLLSASERDPDNPLILETLADYTYTLGKPADAAKLYRRLLDLDHATPRTHAKLGDSLFQSGRYGDAARAYRSALDLRQEQKEPPLPFSVWMQLGEALEKAGRKDEALETYQEAQRLYSELPPQVDSELKRRMDALRDQRKK